MFEVPEWPRCCPAPLPAGASRRCPEDFVVEEIPRVHPAGEGDHLWLWVEKRCANTDWVARELARLSACQPRHVGYAGLKDRHAVSRQWFSVPATAAAAERLRHTPIEGVRILESRKHTRKLKRGTLDGNRFHLRIRGLGEDAGRAAGRLAEIGISGVPNYFGPQRFGRQGRNIDHGFELLSTGARLPRHKRSIYLSALRSYLFNQVLAERVRRGDWNTIIPGDLAMLDGTHSVFPCETTGPDIEQRCCSLDIHPTGPLPGAGGLQPGAEAATLEQAVLRRWPQLTQVLASQGVAAARRSLRLCPAGLEWECAGGDMTLSFTLPPGGYATTVLREVLASEG